jgi:hypothetical protein
MVKNWNTFMLQLQETRGIFWLCVVGRQQTAAMTTIPTMEPGYIFCYNPDAPGSMGAKDDVLWFEFKVSNSMKLEKRLIP